MREAIPTGTANSNSALTGAGAGAIVVALLCSCGSDGGSRPGLEGSSVEIAISALSLERPTDAVWDVEVTSQAGEPVFRVRATSGRYGDGRGSATYVGPCVAGEDNIVNVWLRGVYTATEPLTGDPGEFGAGTPGDGDALVGSADYVNPGRLTRRFSCVENEDVRVAFDVTVMQPARQGFFDIAIDFDDIFCSAKLDAGTIADGASDCTDYDYLHNPDAGDARDRTFVLAVSCTTGEGDVDSTALYIDTITITCVDQIIRIEPCADDGNRRDELGWTGVHTDSPAGDTALTTRIYQVQTSHGIEADSDYDLRYWSAAIGVSDLTGCSLTTKMSADHPIDPVAIGLTRDLTIDAGLIYPVIDVFVPDLGQCALYPLSFGGAEATTPGVNGLYTSGSDVVFDHRCGGDGPSCGDGLENGDETAVDCGGSCARCVDGSPCGHASDCLSGACDMGSCQPPSCVDLVRNGDETDVDCGGSCPPCDDGAGCTDDSDCESLHCPDLLCRPETCFDELHNQNETDVDCGGSCPPCGPGGGCLVTADCGGGLCEPSGFCSAPTCDDGVLNGGETAVDCGGSCPACAAPDPIIGVIAAGYNHTCAVTTAGAAWCWGHGPLGANDPLIGPQGTLFPVQVKYDGTTPLVDVVSFATGNASPTTPYTLHSCAALVDGSLWCWGTNSKGELGLALPNATVVGYPTRVLGPGGVGFLTDIIKVRVGPRFTCAADRDGAAWCWGYNIRGNIGDDTRTDRNTPARVLGPGGTGLLEGVVDLAAGKHTTQPFTCALTGSGSVWCWGASAYLGDGNPSGGVSEGGLWINKTPTRVLGPGAGGFLDDATAISAGYSHTCVIRAGGSIWCWGSGGFGALGDGTGLGRPTPVAVVGLPQGVAAVAISGGFYMTCAALEDGSAWCWGENRDGALGDGTETRRNSAVQVVGVGGVGVLTNAARISCGGVGAHPFCCAQADDDSAWCWGGNDFGKLGTHSTSPSKTSVPVAVQW